MKRGRTLTLKTERLTELASDDLRAVAGGDATVPCATVPCVTGRHCQPSNYAASLCGCLTDYCSFQVC